MSETLGIGYVGLGVHCQQSHALYLEPSPLCETVGVADLVDVDLANVNFVDNPTVTNDYHELLDDERVDAVIITTGDASHFTIAKDAINAGKHVMVEKPAATTAEELGELPALFELADKTQRKLWVCHPREFGTGPWLTATQMIDDPRRVSEAFGTGPMGRVEEVRLDCQYTVPARQNMHDSFADDKLNHTIVTVLRGLSSVYGFRDAVLLDNGPTRYDARLVTMAKDEQDGVVIRAGGRRSAHAEHHEGSVYRDWIEVVYEEGTLRVEPSLGKMVLTYGDKEKEPVEFDVSSLYKGMFGGFNAEFVQCALDPQRPEPLTRRTKLLGTAAAILMQQPRFGGDITEYEINRLRPRYA
jgi:predicted dehydrogenase